MLKLVISVQWLLYFFWLTSSFLICCCIPATFQIVFGISNLIVIVKWWLNDIRMVCGFPTCYQWWKDIPPFSISPFAVRWLTDLHSQTNFLNVFLICEWAILFLQPSTDTLSFISYVRVSCAFFVFKNF